jgi:excisionase family DNA binding protein
MQPTTSAPAAAAVTTAPVLLTKREAAARLRVSERTLHRWLIDGEGPIVTRLGCRVMIREDHLAHWIERCAAPVLVPRRIATSAYGVAIR